MKPPSKTSWLIGGLIIDTVALSTFGIVWGWKALLLAVAYGFWSFGDGFVRNSQWWRTAK